MVWYARNNQLKLAGGNSGSRPTCIPALASFFVGDNQMKTLAIMAIPLTQGLYALVDGEDYESLAKYKWCANETTYGTYIAVRRDNQKIVRMHRQITNAPNGMDVDHQNHATLDNRKVNLRICTRAQNLQNGKPRRNSSSVYKGVGWRKDRNKWAARIMFNGQRIFLGYFNSEIKATKAYDRKARKCFGEFACLNFQDADRYEKDFR